VSLHLAVILDLSNKLQKSKPYIFGGMPTPIKQLNIVGKYYIEAMIRGVRKPSSCQARRRITLRLMYHLCQLR
jgi:hypothetical protein